MRSLTSAQVKKKYKAATPSKRMLRGESAMFDIQPVLSAIPAPISTLVTLYFALNPPLCRLWEPAGALYKSRSSRSCLTLSNRILDYQIPHQRLAKLSIVFILMTIPNIPRLAEQISAKPLTLHVRGHV